MDQKGKPWLNFNLSHSISWALFLNEHLRCQSFLSLMVVGFPGSCSSASGSRKDMASSRYYLRIWSRFLNLMVLGSEEEVSVWSAIHFLIFQKKVFRSLPFLLRAPGLPFLSLFWLFWGISYVLLDWHESPSELSSTFSSISLRSSKCGSYSLGFLFVIWGPSSWMSVVDAIINISFPWKL